MTSVVFVLFCNNNLYVEYNAFENGGKKKEKNFLNNLKYK